MLKRLELGRSFLKLTKRLCIFGSELYIERFQVSKTIDLVSLGTLKYYRTDAL
jgi:hypothetical protein